MFIKSVAFLKDYRNFKMDDSFDLERPIVLLVGDQGSGKSTLISEIFPTNKKSENVKIDAKACNVFIFDFEKNNPRTKGYLEDDSAKLKMQLSTMWCSHGEALVNYSIEALKKAKDCVVLLDEPETALSIRNQYRLAKEIKNSVKRGCQCIIATHCIPLIESQKEVLSLEHKAWMSSKDFIKEQKS